MRTVTFIATCLILSMNLIFADANHKPMSFNPTGVDTIGSASLSTLNLPIILNNDYGQGYFYENPKTDEERYINQGYASLNVFHYVDAYRSFKQAYLENHKSIQALVGMNYAVLTQDTSESGARLASTALNMAFNISQSKEISEQEKVWLNFSKAFYMIKIGSDQLLKDKSSINPSAAFQELMAKDGDNLEAQTFIHWILLNNNNLQYIKATLEGTLNINNDHPGATHYLLHIAEMVDDISVAQGHGKALTKLAPGSAHGQHMYGHTLPQTGEWEKALEQFLIADEIHKNWALNNNVPIQEDWHYAHNLDLLAATYLGLKDYDNALKNWSISMQFDARAIKKMIGLALATNQIQLASDTLSQIEGLGIQYRNYVAFLRSEEQFFKSQKIPTQFPNSHFAMILSKTYNGTSSEADLSSEYEQYFTSLFSSGGFDGWSNGFVELMRAKNIAKALKLVTLMTALEELEVKARTGDI
jgi:tetratricopeptide (TPR) repeat protein